jgi:hypothetical protein
VTKPSPGTALRRIAWELRTIAGARPLLCRLLLRRSGEIATEETEICIEGFQRSGNTFAVIAFQQAQPRTISIAHHVHAPGSVIVAVRMRKPTIVLIRSPDEAVLSTVIRYPHVSISQALRGYRRFYSPLLRYADRVMVARFEDVTTDFGRLIRQVNQRFGTTFVAFESNEANVDSVLAEVDRWDLNTFGEGERLEQGRARPSELRRQAKAELRERYGNPKLARRRMAAERVYESFAGRAG